MNVAGYLRVSTDQQDYSNQLAPIMDYCKARSWPDPVVYGESETAWKQGHQRELARLLAELRSGRRRFDYLVVFALDRLSRGTIGQVLQLVESLELVNCKVVSIKESWIAEAGPMRDVFISLAAWAAKYESDRKSQNTKAGLERTLKAGVTKAGRPISKLGRPNGSRDKVKRHKKRPVVYRYGPSSVAAIGQ
ncbi:MAG: recombinase family protein [Chloroflexi bacterium]|nr:recombinase family protein [Chloroflexota bacterium]